MTHSLSLAMRQYSTESRTKKQVKGYRILSFARKHKNPLLDTPLDVVKVVHKAGEVLENKTEDAVTKTNDENIVKKIQEMSNR